jgi:hypothetical protein
MHFDLTIFMEKYLQNMTHFMLPTANIGFGCPLYSWTLSDLRVADSPLEFRTVNRISSLHKSRIGRDQISEPNSWVKSMFDDPPPRLKSEREVGPPSLDLNSQILPDYLTHAGLASVSHQVVWPRGVSTTM